MNTQLSTQGNRPEPGRLTPSEKGLTKKCNDCKRVLPLHAFYVREMDKFTEDGRRYRMSRCAVCFGKLRKHRGSERGQRVRANARIRAMRRFAADKADEFEVYFNEELRKDGLI